MTADETTRESTSARSLRRALDILTLLAPNEAGLSAAEIVTALGLPRSTAYEILRVMLDTGLVMQPGEGRFRLGPRVFELGMQYRTQDRLLAEGSRVLAALRDTTEETAQLSILDGDRMRIVLKEEGRRALRIISNVGTRVPVNWSASGRLLVSDMEEAALRPFLLAAMVPSPTGKAEMDITRLMDQIRRFRALGHAIEINEANAHAGCVAAPVLDDRGRCVAAVSLAAPESRLVSEEAAALAEAVVAAAARLSRMLYPG